MNRPLECSFLEQILHYSADGLYAQKTKPSDEVHYLVLTDVNGVRTYATCVTYYRSFIAQQVSGTNVNFVLDFHSYFTFRLFIFMLIIKMKLASQKLCR